MLQPSDAGGVGLGGGKSTAKIREVRSYLDKATDDLDEIGALFKSYFKERLGDDDYVHTAANTRDQSDLDEMISALKDELIDVSSNLKAFARLPFLFRTETSYDYQSVPKHQQNVLQKQPRNQDDIYDRYSVDEIRETVHHNTVAIPVEKHVVEEGSRQYAINNEANAFIKFYNTWYANFYRRFKIYSKPLGAVQGLIVPIVDDFKFLQIKNSYSRMKKPLIKSCECPSDANQQSAKGVRTD